MKKQMILNRIELLKSRQRENERIVKKLQRKLRNLKEGE